LLRGGSREAIFDANMKVDRCLRAGAMAMGAEVEINTIPGYLPQRNDQQMGELFGANIEALLGAGSFDIGPAWSVIAVAAAAIRARPGGR
jgi:metal-dependent amidase/aminoacylase/carboxypeptidase family protein